MTWSHIQEIIMGIFKGLITEKSNDIPHYDETLEGHPQHQERRDQRQLIVYCSTSKGVHFLQVGPSGELSA